MVRFSLKYVKSLILGANFSNFQDHGLQCEQITNESFLWMQSLALSDPHYVLPVVYCVLALSNITVISICLLSLGFNLILDCYFTSIPR